MILELTVLKIIQIIFGFIMTFAFAMTLKVSDKTRDIANIVWYISLAIVWILMFLNK